ncbi:AraC family transcriptional regulator [Microlunatus soli]|uniref:Helix-turn-helix domain-containing protein n=1 Tax=Microlunatus soli TaxID=630515 RepID=A0A1H1UTX0_9ACTN|nr:helix-turn-helix domain-containing protein [Microlunatus soli]SDS76038.1 Helix-turn-helix domain-containing protein [Microlunatus soli]
MASISCAGSDVGTVFGAPHPGLDAIVARQYAGWTMRPDRTDRFVVPAHTSVQLVIKIEDSAVRPSEFVCGAADRYADFDGGCAPRYLQVELTPLGAYRILGLPMREIGGRLIDLADLLGAQSGRLGDAVRDAPNWDSRFEAVDRFLLGLANAGPVVSEHIDFAWRELSRSGGAAGIGAICREIGWSHKHLIERFREQIGLTPKRAARVIRFEGLLRRLDGVPPDSWSLVAADCGYSDQAHLIRDFAAFAGSTPSAAASLTA